MFQFDPHLHSIASGHGSHDTITDLAKMAAKKHLNMIGVTDHGPATMHSGRVAYFRNLAHAPKKRCGIDILYGVELNIQDFKGKVDLPDDILKTLDYAIISMHTKNIKPGDIEQNTFAYVYAMMHPKVKIIGHADDNKFPIDYQAVMVAAKHFGVIFEINNCSLAPDGYRGNTKDNIRKILEMSMKYDNPIVLSSDSHGKKNVGNFEYALELIKEMHFPDRLILNYSTEDFKNFIEK